VSSERCQCFAPSIFSDLGIDPLRKRVLIPKSLQHFYGAFAAIAAEVIYMAAPGAVAPDPRLIPYRRLDTRAMYPWVEDPLEVGAQE
jgi:microcystin degradation protein MlrC